jgi:hypothetical protein
MGNERDLPDVTNIDKTIRDVDQVTDAVGDSIGDVLKPTPKYGLDPTVPTQSVEAALRSIHAQICTLCDALGLPRPPNWN